MLLELGGAYFVFTKASTFFRGMMLLLIGIDIGTRVESLVIVIGRTVLLFAVSCK